MSNTDNKIDIKYSEFNEKTQCLHFVFEKVNGTVSSGDYFEFRALNKDTDVVSNSWVDKISTDSSTIAFSATIIFEKNMSFDNYSLYQYSRLGQLKSVLQLSYLIFNLLPTKAGIIGVRESSDSKELEAYFWTSDSDSKCQFGTSIADVEYKSVSQDMFVGVSRSKIPMNRENITVIPSDGSGQKFTNIHPFNGINFPSSAKLKNLKDIHKGKSAWIVGNGPSVEIDDLDILRNEITFCFNRFYLAHDTTSLKATYTVSGDEQMIEDFGQEIVNSNPGQVFLAAKSAPEVDGDYCWLRQISVFPSLFSLEPEYYVTPGGSSLYVAMQLAHYMGIKNLYIYGADFSFNFKRNLEEVSAFRKASGDGNHFIKNYRSGKAWCPPSHRNIANSFFAARKIFEYSGGGIFNATRGGILEIFERISFEEALAKSSK